MTVYETFSKGVVNKEMTLHKKEEFMKMVKKLDDDGTKTFLLLIKFHELKINPASTTIVPYDGISDDRGISYDIDKLPTLLQNILYKFMEMYIKNKQVEMERQIFIN